MFCRFDRKTRGGYTLIEVLIVVSIIAIAGAVVVPTMMDAGTMGVQAATRIVISDLLYAQNDGIAKQKKRVVKFDTFNNSYELLNEKGKRLTAKWINGAAENYSVSFNHDSRFEGVDLKRVDFNGEREVEFDELGCPSEGGIVELGFNGDVYQIEVAAFTGKVSVKRLAEN